MKANRAKNASRNIIVGVILKAYMLLVPFIMRTLMIYCLGVQYLGLNSLFSSVLSVLSLAELGVGSAMGYSMYKPIAEDDTERICALMHLYKIYYRVIGIVIGVIGLALTPFIPKLIKGDVPAGISIYTLYFVNLGVNVISYWLFAYKNALLETHQRTDIGSKIYMGTVTLQYILQIFVLCVLKNYYCYVICFLINNILYNLIVAFVTTKMYPQYQARGMLPKEERKEINHRIKDLFTSKLGMVIVNSADSIVISSFLGLVTLALYQNYFLLVTSVSGFITVIFGSVTAGIGNSLITETEEKNYNDLVKFTFMIAWISSFCMSCFLCMFQPFMRIWVGEEMLVSYRIVICLVLYFYMLQINQVINVFKDAAGMWHEDRFRPMTTAFVNLVLNMIMVQFWGLYGVVFSTLLSWIIVGWPWLLHNLFSVLFDHSHLTDYIKKLIKYSAVTLAVSGISSMVGHMIRINDVMDLILRFLLCLVIPNVLLIIVYSKTWEIRESIILVDRMTRGKVRLGKLFSGVLRREQLGNS